MKDKPHIVVIGGGSWGSALAFQLRQNSQQNCEILVRSAQTKMQLEQGIIFQLPEITGLAPFRVTTDPACIRQADIIYSVVPVSAHLEIFSLIDDYAQAGTPIVLCAKGLVADPQKGGLFLHEYLHHHMPDRPFAILTGPSFADEVLKGLPTALLAASTTPHISQKIADQFSGSQLRIYQGHDVTGAALGGAIKNVMAIAAGICAGQRLGDNARAGLITRGLAETNRLARTLGAESQTISGLAGIGDLVLSCSNGHSRNMAYGFALGARLPVSDRLAEGRYSAAHLIARAAYEKTDMPICAAVDQVVNHNADIEMTIRQLLARSAGLE